ncbi:Qat anti-phage system QueC-like protein QatC [Aureimonas sp. ME7]|uniref:Qat anti-phage system QueC-like protein QatC n=1 Tax=Aureimonas sp. ME7 TaxID=2744252 RepID=UPI0015F71BAD|nr:Qat anti-phage system QueC-like protein QatC [Aureimonas sp. ME7]
MNRLVFHVDEEDVPVPGGSDTVHVHLYGRRPKHPGTASIGGSLEVAIARLGVPVAPLAFDFLSIALAVVAADTFVDRSRFGTNGWSRELALEVPLCRPGPWSAVAGDIERALAFLSGDTWRLTFVDGGRAPPGPEAILRRHRSHVGIGRADCVSLFSGGLDSLIGAVDLIREGRSPLLVSHSYRGDQSYQRRLAPRLGKVLPRFAANANPVFSGPNVNDTSMRTRSLGFLAYGVVAATALGSVKPQLAMVDLVVPENGFIALNAPLTRRRVGSHSTRTTHPDFLDRIQSVLDFTGMQIRIGNPYRHMTKGEMLSELAPAGHLAETALGTVSCGKWKRRSQQCGHCVPCLIRRAAFAAAGMTDTTNYRFSVGEAWERPDISDDIMAMRVASSRDPRGRNQRALASGPLPLDPSERQGWFGVHQRGLEEVGMYLERELG